MLRARRTAARLFQWFETVSWTAIWPSTIWRWTTLGSISARRRHMTRKPAQLALIFKFTVRYALLYCSVSLVLAASSFIEAFLISVSQSVYSAHAIVSVLSNFMYLYVTVSGIHKAFNSREAGVTCAYNWTWNLLIVLCFMLGKPFVNMTAENMTVNEGQTQLNLSVNVHSYPNEPNLTWYKDGHPLTIGSNGGRYLAMRFIACCN